MRRSRRLAVGLLAASLGPAAAATPAPTVSPARPFAVEGVFQTADRPPARDLSGIACKPAPEGAAQHLCLVVNDRDRFAQIATLTAAGSPPARRSCSSALDPPRRWSACPRKGWPARRAKPGS